MRRGALTLPLMCAALLVLIAWGAAPAQAATEVGKVFDAKGQARVENPALRRDLAAAKDMVLYESDKIVTGPSSQARLILADRTLVNVGEDSVLELSQFRFNAQEKTRDAKLDLPSGRVKLMINDVLGFKERGFQIKTPTAVAGVRGTVLYAVVLAPKKTMIFGADNPVWVANLIRPAETVTVGNRTLTYVIDDQPPTPPRPPNDEEEQLLHKIFVDLHGFLGDLWNLPGGPTGPGGSKPATASVTQGGGAPPTTLPGAGGGRAPLTGGQTGDSGGQTGDTSGGGGSPTPPPTTRGAGGTNTDTTGQGTTQGTTQGTQGTQGGASAAPPPNAPQGGGTPGGTGYTNYSPNFGSTTTTAGSSTYTSGSTTTTSSTGGPSTTTTTSTMGTTTTTTTTTMRLVTTTTVPLIGGTTSPRFGTTLPGATTTTTKGGTTTTTDRGGTTTTTTTLSRLTTTVLRLTTTAPTTTLRFILPTTRR